jgi:hypothetical protein
VELPRRKTAPTPSQGGREAAFKGGGSLAGALELGLFHGFEGVVDARLFPDEGEEPVGDRGRRDMGYEEGVEEPDGRGKGLFVLSGEGGAFSTSPLRQA